MANLFENLPYSLNNEFRGYLVYNFKLLNQNQLMYERHLNNHKNQESGAHTTSQINHKNKPLDKKIDALEGRIDNQIYGASKNSSAEVKDLRVGNDGTVHELAQTRMLNDFSKIDTIAKRADDLAQELESEANESAYYNEITYISGRKFDTTYKIVHIPYRDSDGNVIQIRKGISGANPSRPDHITPRQFSKQKGATFVSNASTGSGSTLKLHGQQIYVSSRTVSYGIVSVRVSVRVTCTWMKLTSRVMRSSCPMWISSVSPGFCPNSVAVDKPNFWAMPETVSPASTV